MIIFIQNIKFVEQIRYLFDVCVQIKRVNVLVFLNMQFKTFFITNHIL